MHGIAVTLGELNGNQKKHKGTLQLLFMLFFILLQLYVYVHFMKFQRVLYLSLIFS